MRVAFVSLFTPHHGDTPPRRRTRRTARQLADRGHDVTWLCAQWWGGDHGAFTEDGIDYRRVVADPDPTGFAVRLPAALRRADPDVVHAVNSPPGAALAAATSRPIHRAPVVVDWWCDRPEDGRLAYGLLARRADAVVAPARTVATRVREHGAPDDAVETIPESVDLDLVESAPVDDRFDVVYSRRLDRHANVESFLLGLAELREADWSAAVIGDGPERSAAEATAAELRIADRVRFLGDRPLPERVAIFKGAHVFAQTALREAFASELLRALACGCVGLVEYQAGSSAHELVEGDDRASLVTSPQELAAAFRDAAARPRRTVGEGFETYGRRPILERYLERYRSLLDERGQL
ncbi:glycosyltransferase [Halopenitus persicus]|uniref:Glycosyltransferase involved in cell wall bisynthesis n=1 Tax=Halopenitus persicus TaxID=1048396 RepID=A0A1H3IP52_9EURY|nr:glycosyltransferase [Halopenitus persicus]SDY29471.1 Glycosyltransferase involved in cell wall bisynthesis [Halopenitus persicus]